MVDKVNEDGNTSKAPDSTAIAAEAAKVADAVKRAEETAETERKAAEAKAEADRKAAGESGADSELVAKLVKERLDAELAGIKTSLNNAYAARDALQAKLAKIEAEEREANLKRLAEEGKHKEAYEIQLAEERAANAALAKRNTELSRDVTVREAIRELQFRSGKAATMAFQEITSNLVQDENKQWVHRSGVSIREYVDAFAKDEEQSFLFKAKVSSGAGTSSATGAAPQAAAPTSLFKMSQEEVLRLAVEGKLPPKKR